MLLARLTCGPENEDDLFLKNLQAPFKLHGVTTQTTALIISFLQAAEWAKNNEHKKPNLICLY
jgi:hypothetical protein